MVKFNSAIPPTEGTIPLETAIRTSDKPVTRRARLDTNRTRWWPFRESQYFIEMTTMLGIEVWGSRSHQVDRCQNATIVSVVAKDIATPSPADKESRDDLTRG